MIQSIDKDIVERVIANVASPKEAIDVVDWFSSTEEGQEYLSEMLDKDAKLIDNNSSTEDAISQSQSDDILERIMKLTRISNIE